MWHIQAVSFFDLEYTFWSKKINKNNIEVFIFCQQDTFLPHVENGTITLIGATTENPSFSLNNALLSRCQVVTLDKLSTQNIIDILYRAVHFASGSIISPAHTCSTNEVE